MPGRRSCTSSLPSCRSLSASPATLRTSNARFGRWNDTRQTFGSFIPSCTSTSSAIAGVAVAVNPRIGGRPSTFAARRNPRYDGRKSWPHCDTQCASSTQNNENFTPASASCVAGVFTDSGVIITMRTLPSRTAARSAARSFAVRVESMRTIGTPAALSLPYWSSISASSGDTTSVGPSITSAGTW